MIRSVLWKIGFRLRDSVSETGTETLSETVTVTGQSWTRRSVRREAHKPFRASGG